MHLRSIFVFTLILASLHADEFEWSVLVGNGGLRVPSGWSYVVVNLENKGRQKKGEVVLRCPGSTLSHYHLPFELSRRSEQRHFLYFQSEGNVCDAFVKIDDEIVDESRQVMLDTLYASGAVIEVGLSTHIARSFSHDSFNISPYARSDWTNLPDNPFGYDGVAWLLLSDLHKADGLSNGQSRTLRTWVETGGNVMIFLGRDGAPPKGVLGDLIAEVGFGVSGIKDIHDLPDIRKKFRIDKLASLSVPTLSAPKGSVMWTEGGTIISAVGRLGWGKVGICAIHPGRLSGLPVQSSEFWKQLGGIEIHPAPRMISEAQELLSGSSHERFAEKFGDLLLPGDPAFPVSMVWAIIYLFAYFSAIGPLQGWMLRRGRPLRECLFVFLVSVAVFMVFANTLARWKKGDEIWERDIGIVTIGDSGAARGMMYSTYYVPTSVDMKLACGSSSIAAPLLAGDFTPVNKKASLRHWDSWYRAGSTEVKMDFRQWDLRVALTAFWHVPARLEGVSPRPRGMSPILMNAHLIQQTAVIHLGRIDLREDLDISLQARRRLSYTEFASSNSAYRSGHDHSQFDLEKILLSLCIGEPHRVTDIDVRSQLARGRSVLVGFSKVEELEPKATPKAAKRLTVCLIRQIVSF